MKRVFVEQRNIEGKICEYHHTAACKGYVSRKATLEMNYIPYNGKFGKGYKLYIPRYDTTRYCYVEYWIEC